MAIRTRSITHPGDSSTERAERNRSAAEPRPACRHRQGPGLACKHFGSRRADAAGTDAALDPSHRWAQHGMADAGKIDDLRHWYNQS